MSRSFCNILTMLGCVDVDLWDCSDECIPFCSINEARGYAHFFCLLCVSEHVLADAKGTTQWIKILDHGTHTTVGSLHPHRILSKHIFAYTGFSKEYHLSPFKSYLSTFGSCD